MNIIFLDWPCFCRNDAIDTLVQLGHSVSLFFHPDYDRRISAEFENAFDLFLSDRSYDCVFSYNYFPLVSECCKRHDMHYISVVYDSPHVFLYSYTVINPCNYIFLFDRAQYRELADLGIHTVYYLPLAGNADRIQTLLSLPHNAARYIADVSFVGSLYNESHNLFERLTGLNDYTRGYLDGLMQAQLRVYGYYFIEEALTEEVLADLRSVSPYDAGNTGIQSERYIYSNYFIGRKLTELDRIRTLTSVAKEHPLRLYTHDRSYAASGIQNAGPVDYAHELPYVFHYSKINLNLTLKSIKSGMPLRAIEIMSAGGFLLTNFQADFLDYFIPDTDFVYYNDLEDLNQKIHYYLAHDEERRQIAANGQNKVRQSCSFHRLFTEIFHTAFH